MSSRPSPPLGSYRGSSPALDRRGWNLALAFQEVFTAVIRLRYKRQDVPSADAFRGQIKHALRAAEQEAHSGGYATDDVRRAMFALVAFLDESALSCRNPAFSDWPRLPLQAELYGHQLAGEVFFQELQKVLDRGESKETADLLEVYFLCLLLGFKGRYAAGGDLRAVMARVREKIRRINGPLGALSPRGTIPSEVVRLTQSDPWARKLAFVAIACATLAVSLFIIFKLLLVSTASEISASAATLVK